jgi:hypothetical protein
MQVRGHEGVQKAVEFYQQGIGLNVLRHTESWAELACPVSAESLSGNAEGTSLMPQPNIQNNGLQSSALSAFRLNIKAVDGEAQLGTGYSPFLSFDILDMDTTVARCAQMGAHLDGPIQYPAHGKVRSSSAGDHRSTYF